MSGGDDDNEGAGPRLSRRDALQMTFAVGVTATSMTFAVIDPAQAAGAFLHGVASGDPLSDRVVIWTRVTDAAATKPIPVAWTVAEDARMQRVVRSGETTAHPARDFTVKVDVDGLTAGRTYYYRFDAAGALSPVGRTKTLPLAGVTRLKFAVFSCSNFELGYFNAYREAAKHSDLDAVLHLGDYIYEYGREGYVTPASGLGLVPRPRENQLQPAGEIVALQQYRARHALYKTDADLQRIHRDNPFIAIWDDHEITNDAWRRGAENHQPETEGSFGARKVAAVKAYYEWMPIRDPEDGRRFDHSGGADDLYRVFDFGDLARLIMIDTRNAGRDEQLPAERLAGAYVGRPPQGPFPADVNAAGAARSIMGKEQETWFDDQIAESKQRWQLIGNQVLMFYQGAPDIAASRVLSPVQKVQFNGVIDQIFGEGFSEQLGQLGAAGLPFPIAADAWTGYPTARVRMLRTLARANNPVVLTGDSHNAWVANLRLPTAEGEPLRSGVEFGTTSVSSPGYEQFLLGVPPELISAVLQETTRRSAGDKLVYSEQSRRGFMLVEVTPKVTTVDHVFLSTVFTRGYTVETKRFRVPANAHRAVEVS